MIVLRFSRDMVLSLTAAFIISMGAAFGASPDLPSFQFSGKVVDSRTNLPVDAAVVSIVETHLRAATDTAGIFRFALPEGGRFTLSVRRIGYAASERTITTGDAAGVHAGNASDASASVTIALHPVMIQSDEVIIRSTRVQSTVNEHPMPFSIIAGEELASRPSLTAADAMRSVPGITLVRDGSWETAVSIRGMSRSNIVMMVDNTRIETANDIAGAFSLIDVHELERIEVVKAPGSSLWGSGALGGVVHMMTKLASFSDAPASRLQIDEQASGVNGLLAHHLSYDHASDRIGFRLGLGYRHAGNTSTPDGVIPNSQFTDMNVSGSLGVKTYDTQTLFISYQRSQAENTGIPGGAAIASQAKARYTSARRELVSAEYTLPELSRAVDLFALRVSRQTITRNVEIIQTPTLTLTPHAVHGTTSAQIESRIRLRNDLTMTAGVDAWQRSLESRREKINSARHEITEERPVPSSSFLSAGSYLHAAWIAAPDRVTVDAGARYDWIRVKNETTFNPEYVIGSNGIMNFKPAGQTILWREQAVSNRSWSANAGLRVALSDAADISCMAAAAFRSPSLEERFQYIDLGSIVRIGNPALKPEQSTSLNLGFALHGSRASLRADVFINSLTDLVTEVPGLMEGRSALIKTNVGEAVLYGGELAGELPLSDLASVQYSAAYVHGEDTRAHAPLPQIAPLTGSLTLNTALWSAGTVSLGASFALRQDRTAAGEVVTPGYCVFDLEYASRQLHLLPFLLPEGPECTIRCGVENMLNASYRLHLSTLRGTVQREPGRNLFIAASIIL